MNISSRRIGMPSFQTPDDSLVEVKNSFDLKSEIESQKILYENLLNEFPPPHYQ